MHLKIGRNIRLRPNLLQQQQQQQQQQQRIENLNLNM
jgi:hypothetical protein